MRLILTGALFAIGSICLIAACSNGNLSALICGCTALIIVKLDSVSRMIERKEQ